MTRNMVGRAVILCILTVIVCCMFLSPAFAAGTQTLISTGTPSSDQTAPQIWGDYIVWQDQRDGGSFIFLYNLVTGDERRISSLSSSSYAPRIQGNSVVWYEINEDEPDIYLYDIPSGITTRITDYPADKSTPVVYGTKIAWQELINNDENTGYSYYDVIMYDTATGTFQNVSPDNGQGFPPDSSHEAPSICGDRVVWQGTDDSRGDYDLFMNDTSTGTVTDVSDNDVIFSQKYPVISGDIIAWMDDRNGDLDIYAYDLNNPGDVPISVHAGSDQQYPAISGNNIFWLDNRQDIADYSLGMYNLTTATETFPLISDNNQVEPLQIPGAYGNRVVWEDIGAGQNDIYLYTDGVEETCPVASFTHAVSTGGPPLAVHFTDTSSGTPSHWHWDFGDGSNSTEPSPTHTFTLSGTFPVTLTVGTPLCRNATPVSTVHNISVGSAPIAGFSGTPRSGMVPLTVVFTDSSQGSPALWNWSFGDGEYSESQDPTHVYATGGTYTVRLNATNVFGSGYKTQTGYITATTGAHEVAFTNITGITVTPSGVHHKLIYNTVSLPSYQLTGTRFLMSVPPAGYGWQNLSFFSDDGIGFTVNPGVIKGDITTVMLKTKDIRPSGFSTLVGNNIELSHQAVYETYQSPASFTVDAWEGTVPSDKYDFNNVITHANFASMNVSYSVNTTRTGLGLPVNMTLNMSVGSGWLTGDKGIAWGKDHTYVIATGYDADGTKKGMVIPAAFLFNNTVTKLEYFRADIPEGQPYFTKFALAKLSGSGNPLQLITLTIAAHAGPGSPDPAPYSPAGSDSDSGTGTSTGSGTGKSSSSLSGQGQSVQNNAGPSFVEQATTAKVYTNQNGVVSQATTLVSADNLATITLDKGVTAKDAQGNPLSSVTMTTKDPASIPSEPSGSLYSFAGMAYELGPAGSTFTPSLTLSFTVPQVSWGKDYTIRTYDKATGAWQDLLTTFDPSTGRYSAQVSHFSIFALFSKTATEPPVQQATPAQVPTPAPVPPTAPPSTAISIFTSMMAWVSTIFLNNAAIFIILVLLTGGYLVFKKGKYPGSGLY